MPYIFQNDTNITCLNHIDESYYSIVLIVSSEKKMQWNLSLTTT